MTDREFIQSLVVTIKQIIADYDKIDVNECPECHYAEKRVGAIGAYTNVIVALEEQLKTEPDVTLKEFREYAISRPYLTGTEKLRTFCGVDMDEVEERIKRWRRGDDD